MKELNVKKLEVAVIENKLNKMEGTNTKDKAFLTMLTLNSPSPKHGMPANAPFPAVVKKALGGGLAVFSCVTCKQEIIPACSYKEPTPIHNMFEYKGHRYVKNPVYPIYTLEK